ITIDVATGWPTGSVGPFFAVLARGQSTEEKVLVTSRTSTTLNTVTRGADGTTAVAHDTGVTIEICLSARDLDEANKLVAQTLGAVTTKGALPTATGTAALGVTAAGADGDFLLSDSGASTGWAAGPIPAGAISDSAMFATGIINGAAIA